MSSVAFPQPSNSSSSSRRSPRVKLGNFVGVARLVSPSEKATARRSTSVAVVT